MHTQTQHVGAAAVSAILLTAGTASAASLNHPGPVVVQDGAYSAIVETSITDTPPLYGAPTAGTGNELVFPMPGFSASASNSASDIDAGAMEFTFDADPGKFIDTISLSESGAFSILGDASVTAAGTLTVRYFDDNTQQIETLADPILMTTDPLGGFPVDAPGAGTWQGSALIDLTALGIQTSQVFVALDNSLIASAGPEGSATISKDELTVNTTVIPEPASVALMAMGLVMVARKRG